MLFRYFFGRNVRIVCTSFKVKSYFSLKCSTPLPLLSNVVYKFQCLRNANQFYIGKTKRHLATRMGEHKHANSAVYDHLNDCQVCKDMLLFCIAKHSSSSSILKRQQQGQQQSSKQDRPEQEEELSFSSSPDTKQTTAHPLPFKPASNKTASLNICTEKVCE